MQSLSLSLNRAHSFTLSVALALFAFSDPNIILNLIYIFSVTLSLPLSLSHSQLLFLSIHFSFSDCNKVSSLERVLVIVLLRVFFFFVVWVRQRKSLLEWVSERERERKGSHALVFPPPAPFKWLSLPDLFYSGFERNWKAVLLSFFVFRNFLFTTSSSTSSAHWNVLWL